MSPSKPDSSNRLYVLVALFGLLLSIPTLLNGFGLDDYLHIASIEGWYPEKEPSLNLYSDFLECPYLPWFTYPEMRISFWRPLTSIFLRLDYQFFGRNAFLYHVHSLLWFLALIAVCGRLFTRLPKTVGVVALLLFALDECHAMNAGYIANRHSMIAAVPALLGLHMHLRWREDRWLPGLPLSILGYAIGLLGGEAAFSVLAYVLAYELLVGPKGSSMIQRFGGVSPAALLAGFYLTAYKAMGFGASGSGYYLDPTGQPLEFLLGAIRYIPVLMGAMLTAFPADLWMISDLRHTQVIVGVGSTVGMVAWLAVVWHGLPNEQRRCVRWFGGGALGALLPMAAAQPADRQLLVPMMGVSAVLAVMLVDVWRRLSSSPQAGKHWPRWVAGSALGLLILIHCCIAPVSRLASQYMFGKITPSLTDVVAQIPAAHNSSSVFFLINAPDLFTTVYVPVIHDYYGSNSMSWATLSMAPFDQRLRRTGLRTLELSILSGQMLQSDAEQVIRPSSQKLHAGDKIHHQQLFDVEIMESNNIGPTRVMFKFHSELDKPEWIFLAWTNDGLSTVPIPAVGQSIGLIQAPGPVKIR